MSNHKERFKRPQITETTRDTKQVCPEPCAFADACFSHKSFVPNDPIANCYDEIIKTTITERSSSLVVRSEQLFHGNDFHRLSLRKHIHELVTVDPNDDREFGLACEEFRNGDELGRYLGYVDLRTQFKGSPIAFALLAPPSRFLDDPSIYIITGEYSAIYGGDNFQCSVYSMQDPLNGGAKCAQMCITIALGFLSDRKANLKGAYTISCIASLGEEKLRNEEDIEYRIVGLDIFQTENVLRSCNVSPLSIFVDSFELKEFGKTVFLKMIQAYIYARFPVIMSVQTQNWYQDTSMPDAGHNIVVVGVKYGAEGSHANSFIIHDPGRAPFIQKPEGNFVNETKITRKKKNETESIDGWNMCFVADSALKTHLVHCLKYLNDYQPYLVIRDEFREKNNQTERTQFRLLSGKSLIHLIYGAECKSQECIPTGRYWTITAYFNPSSVQFREHNDSILPSVKEELPLYTIIFDAEESPTKFIGIVFRRDGNQLIFRSKKRVEEMINQGKNQ